MVRATVGVERRRAISAPLEVAQAQQQVVDAVGVARAQPLGQLLQLLLHRAHASGSSSSRSSASPSSSRSCAWSMVSAWARRSASGASPS